MLTRVCIALCGGRVAAAGWGGHGTRHSEQDLANFLQLKDYKRAVVLCHTLDKPRRLLAILGELIDAGDAGACMPPRIKKKSLPAWSWSLSARQLTGRPARRAPSHGRANTAHSSRIRGGLARSGGRLALA